MLLCRSRSFFSSSFSHVRTWYLIVSFRPAVFCLPPLFHAVAYARPEQATGQLFGRCAGGAASPVFRSPQLGSHYAPRGQEVRSSVKNKKIIIVRVSKHEKNKNITRQRNKRAEWIIVRRRACRISRAVLGSILLSTLHAAR